MLYVRGQSLNSRLFCPAANGEKFHIAFLSFFRLYVRLFLNSFGINGPMSSVSTRTPADMHRLTSDDA